MVESDAADFLDGAPPARLQELHKAHGTTRESLSREAIDKASPSFSRGQSRFRAQAEKQIPVDQVKFFRSSWEGVGVFPRVGTPNIFGDTRSYEQDLEAARKLGKTGVPKD